MKFVITCAAYCRLASIPAYFEPSTDPEIKRLFSCIRIENKENKSFAISTNQKIAAIEYLGPTTEPDGAMHLVVDPTLIKICQNEAPFDSRLDLVYLPEIHVATAVTMFGVQYQGNPVTSDLPDDPRWNWRTWRPTRKPATSKGALYFNVDHIQTLVAASPSGKVVFPEFIDVDQPVVLRDAGDENWVGLFMGKPGPLDDEIVPAELPEWLK